MSTTAEDALKTAVQAAIDGLRAQFDHVRVVPDGQGGAWVEIDELALGPVYAQPSTSMICLLPFNLPNADVYPVFVRADLGRADGAPLGEGFQLTQVQLPGEPSARPAVQVSRRTRESQVVVQTAAQKLEKEQGLFDEQRARFEPVDAQVLQSYVSMWNESVEYGWIDEQPLPEEDIRVTLQRSFSSDAEARNYTRKAEMYDKRLSSAPRLLCAERGLDETPENIAESEARLTAILDERARFGDDERQEATAQAKAPEQTRGAV